MKNVYKFVNYPMGGDLKIKPRRCNMHNNNTNKPKYGTIEKDSCIFRQCIGEATTSDGKIFEITTTMCYEPLIEYGNKMYRLSWEDICNMAEEAGLFEED